LKSRGSLAQGHEATPAGDAAAALPLLARTSPTSAQPLSANAGIEFEEDFSGSRGSPDLRSTAPPVLKALPVDETATRRTKLEAARSKQRQPDPEARQPAPFTR